MSGKKILITSGCSFSDVESNNIITTWPAWLRDSLGLELSSTGMSSQGNGLISRKIIYDIQRLSKFVSYSDMLVGIMWSGPPRSEIYKRKGIRITDDANRRNMVTIQNPTTVNKISNKWYVMNPWWNGYPYVSEYYSLMDMEYLYIKTYEDILRTQDFLKVRGINYFMTTYTGEVFHESSIFDETKHLYDMVDFDNFLDVEGCYEWCRDNTSIPFPPKDNHPSSEQHKIFTNQVIIPFLKEKGYV